MDSVKKAPSLTESIDRDNATLVSQTKQTIVFVCKCGTQHSKSKRSICQTSGAFCKDCTEKNTPIKRIKAKIHSLNAILQNTVQNLDLTQE